jgi:ubiquinone biosynthesis protein COQ9
MARKRDDAGKCLDAALTLAAAKGWNNTTLFDIAEESGLAIAEVRAAVSGRHGLLCTLAERADQAMLLAVDADWREESIRDRLFTLLMARFDFLKDRREGMRAILAGMPADPGSALAAAAGPGLSSMRLMLEAAGLSSAGPRGAMRARALGVTYALLVRTFLDDDTEDLSRTMAAADRRLADLERLASRGRGRRKAEKASENSE